MSISLALTLIGLALLTAWQLRGAWEDRKRAIARAAELAAENKFLKEDNENLRRSASNFGNTVGELLAEVDALKAACNLRQNSKRVVEQSEDLLAEIVPLRDRILRKERYAREIQQENDAMLRELDEMTRYIQGLRNGTPKNGGKR